MAMLKSRRILKKIKISLRPILTYADEAHHTSAGSYKRVMDYFTPEFTLGMTKFLTIILPMRFDYSRLWMKIYCARFIILESQI